MAQFDNEQLIKQIEQSNAALMHLCRKHGMPEGMDLCLTWLDETLTTATETLYQAGEALTALGARVTSQSSMMDGWREELTSIEMDRRKEKARADKAEARIADLEAERAARHANPADFRYWEGRYRDEKARVVDLEAELGGLRDMIQSAEVMTATGEGLDPDETIRLHLMFGAARGDQPVTTERLSKALIDANARLIQIEGVAKRVLHDIDDLVANSEGVSGLHMNGEVADWTSLMAGGSFGSWLESVEDLRAALPAPVTAIDAAEPAAPAEAVWQLIETAPKDRLIDIWLSDGVRWCDCYYDRICDEWRTSRPSGRLLSIKAKHVTHWMPPPEPPVSP